MQNDMIDDDFRRYAIRSTKNPEIILAWSESRKVADALSRTHIVTRTSDGLRIFPPEAVSKAISRAMHGIQARIG